MKVVRVLNNNIVATITEDNKEAVAQGSGIGFQKKPGDILDRNKIEKLYVFQDEEQAKFLKLLEDTPIEYFQVAEQIVEQAQRVMQFEMSNKVLISLTDHISFAIERQKHNMTLPNLMLHEVKLLYPQEYEIGIWSLTYIKDKLHITLEQDEAGYIAIHLVNAQLNVSKERITNILQLCSCIISIIQKHFSINLDENSLEYSRMITHLKYLAQRIFTKQEVHFEESKEMFKFLLQKDTRLKPCVEEVVQYIWKKFGYAFSQEEQVYFMIHLLKVIR